MSDDFLRRARLALHDMQGRVEGGKLAMFERTIDYAEALQVERDDAKAELAALRKGRGVKVKPLVWNDYEQAQCLGICWEMYETTPGLYNVMRCAPHAERLGTKVTQSEAFNLAQADCDRRILSALSPAPVSVGEATEEHCAKCGAPRSNHPYRHIFVPAALSETEGE